MIIKKLDNRIADLPLSVIDLMLDIEDVNDQLKAAVNATLYFDQEEQRVMSDAFDVSLRLVGDQPAHIDKRDLENLEIMAKRKEWEAHAYCEVLYFLFENYRDIAITKENILSLHHQLYRYAPESVWHKGKIRKGTNRVETKDHQGKTLRVLVEGTDPKHVPRSFTNLITWYNESPTAIKYPPLLRISSFLVDFLKIHPFEDGNGRVSRALMDLMLLKAGYVAELYYPHEKIIEEDTEAYYLSLSRSQKTFGTDNESIRTWTEYFLETVLEQTKRAIALQAPVTAKKVTAARY